MIEETRSNMGGPTPPPYSRIVKLMLLFWAMFFLGYIAVVKVYGQEIKFSGPVEEKRTTEPVKSKDLDCVAGDCRITGSLFVDPVLGAKRIELPEVSTPTARSNKAILWLCIEGSSQTIKVTFEDGTTKNLISNKTP